MEGEDKKKQPKKQKVKKRDEKSTCCLHHSRHKPTLSTVVSSYASVSVLCI